MRALVLSTVICGIVVGQPALCAADEPTQVRTQQRFGLGVGGPGPLQFFYRHRVAGPLFGEVGMFAAPPFLLGNLGLVAESQLSRRWSVYVGAGVGAIAAFDEGECPSPPASGCVDWSDWLYAHARTGVALDIGGLHDTRGARQQVSVDLGLWRGIARDHAAGAVTRRKPFWIPMAGLSWLVAF